MRGQCTEIVPEWPLSMPLQIRRRKIRRRRRMDNGRTAKECVIVGRVTEIVPEWSLSMPWNHCCRTWSSCGGI